MCVSVHSHTCDVPAVFHGSQHTFIGRRRQNLTSSPWLWVIYVLIMSVVSSTWIPWSVRCSVYKNEGVKTYSTFLPLLIKFNRHLHREHSIVRLLMCKCGLLDFYKLINFIYLQPVMYFQWDRHSKWTCYKVVLCSWQIHNFFSIFKSIQNSIS